jgi:hypothetical protein
MANSFEEEMFFVFEEDNEQLDTMNTSILNTTITEEVNEYLYCGCTKYCVC